MSGLLTVEGVTKRYRARGRTHTALVDVSLGLAAGETIAVVGESGAGKSTLGRLIAGLDQPTEGSVRVNGVPHRLRSGPPSAVQMVFQHPLDALNPLRSVGSSIAAPLRRLPRRARAERVAELMTAVGLDPGRSDARPRGFSGGQLQRIVIARALAARPQLLVCDEPTSALDVSVQAQIVNLLMELQDTHGFGCVLVTHDLAVARVLADRVLVLKDGFVVEHRAAGDFFRAPEHEYSRTLLAANADRQPMLDDRQSPPPTGASATCGPPQSGGR